MKQLAILLSVLFSGPLLFFVILWYPPKLDLKKEEREEPKFDDAIDDLWELKESLKASLLDPLDKVTSPIIKFLKKALSGPDDEQRIVSGYLHRGPFHGKLKPCPFCGAEIEITEIKIEVGYTQELLIHCSRCGTDFELHEQDRDTYTTIDGDIYQIINGSPFDLWNTRASDGKGGK